jgi:hypothetical protein
MYCGAALPKELLADVERSAQQAIKSLDERLPAADGAAPAPHEPSDRVLLVLDLRQADPGALARALGLSTFEAGQRCKRGGLQLHRIAPRAEALADAERVAGLGVPTFTLDEAEAQTQPVLVGAGRLEAAGLVGRAAEGRFEWRREDLLLVVKGPIQRQHQAEGKNVKRLRTASPSDGYRFHLHRRSDRRPLELNPDAFDFEAERGKVASSLLRINAWLESFDPKPAVDDGFRFLPPALGAGEEDKDTARALGRAADHKGAAAVLDNVRQFRFYSGWRGALARRG